MSRKMKWEKLLSRVRLVKRSVDSDKARTDFERDIDRITFSQAFRRLAHKTQVHPMAQNDHVHNRLLHSLEVASVGRSLGQMAENALKDSKKIPKGLEFAAAVRAACLAHDIGNPPFGHSGETSIQQWFEKSTAGKTLLKNLKPAEQADFLNFEGNAQGFRQLTQLENSAHDGGLRLTYAVLGTFMKYPVTSQVGEKKTGRYKKHGINRKELEYFCEVASGLGLFQLNDEEWCRHPLTFLVEAADDICYCIVDLEDAVLVKEIEQREMEDLVVPLVGSEIRKGERIDISWLRARAIDRLVRAAAETFAQRIDDILRGSYTGSLLETGPYAKTIKTIKKFSDERIYRTERKIKLELAGHKIIYGLLDELAPAAIELQQTLDIEKLSRPCRKLAHLFVLPPKVIDPIDACHRLTDFVAGMTDRFASTLYKQITGQELPR